MILDWIANHEIVHLHIETFIIILLLFRIVYNTELDVSNMTKKEKVLHYLILIIGVLFAFLLSFQPFLNFTHNYNG